MGGARTIKTLFWLSDVFGWLFICLGLLIAFYLAAFGPLLSAMDREPLSWPRLISTIVFALLVAKGAFSLTQRRPWGIVLVLIPGIAALVDKNWIFGFSYLVLCLFVFGLPLLLVFIEVRNVAVGKKN